ncbi:MAG: 50S ribosomal protein L23 [Patescibacteria group bacterium]
MSNTVLKQPVLTEKTVRLAATDNTYTFDVVRSATKNQIGAAVTTLYSVDVVGVRTIMRHADTRRTGRRRTTMSVPKTKKALVTLKKGQNIAAFDISDAAAEK